MKPWYRRSLILIVLLLLPATGTAVWSASAAGFANVPEGSVGRTAWLWDRVTLPFREPVEAVLPPGVAVAGLPLGGLTFSQAWEWLDRHRLAPLRQPLPLQLGTTTIELDPDVAGLRIGTAAVWARLQEMVGDWPPRRWAIYLGSGFEWTATRNENLSLTLDVDEAPLREALESLALAYRQDPVPLRATVISGSAQVEAVGVDPFWMAGVPVAAFLAPLPGWRLDVERNLPPVESALASWSREPVPLTVTPVPPPEPELALLETVLENQVERMPAVVGLYLQDLETGREVGIHPQVVFSAASVMKIAILLQAYRVLDGPPSAQVGRDLQAMMIRSENAAANRLMKFGGEGDAPRGLQRMTETLRRLGLTDSFMCNTYDGGPRWRGCPPQPRAAVAGEPETKADAVLQTTPRDTGLLLSYLYWCRAGQGPLLEAFPGEITAAECGEMIDLMQRNADVSRLVAGVPDIAVAHKSGWIDEMKADAGLFFTTGGDYVLSIFIWQEGGLSEWESSRWLARLSWIVYTFFNPL
jgi:beta-lactamase class A